MCFENTTLNIPRIVRCGAFVEKSDSRQVPVVPEVCSAALCSPLQHALVSCCLLSLYKYGLSGQMQACPSLTSDFDRLEHD